MKKSMLQWFGILLASVGVLHFSAAPAFSLTPTWQDEESDGGEGSESDTDQDEDEAEDKDRWYAVVGGDIYTGTGAVLKGATLLSHNGRIVQIGYNVDIPESAEVLSATGYRVYPGIVAIASTGLFGGGSDLANSVDPYSQGMLLGLASGITSAVQGGEIAKLKRGFIEGTVMRSNFFQSMRLGTNNPSGKMQLREKFEEASKYLRKYRRWRNDRSKDKGPEPKATGIDMGIVAVLRGERRAYFSESQRADLLDIASLAQKYGFRPVISGGTEAWTVADELGRAGATVILTPRTRNDKSEQLVRDGGSSIENAAILHRSGVQVVVRSPSQGNSTMGGIAGRDVIHIPISASFAVRGGLPEQAALESITINPARIAGVSHRIGTLEVGKDADFIVTDGDLLHYATFVQWAVVDGEMVYDKQAEMYYAHIRPRAEAALAPAIKTDPGEGEEESSEEAGEGEESDEDASKDGDDEKESDS